MSKAEFVTLDFFRNQQVARVMPLYSLPELVYFQTSSLHCTNDICKLKYYETLQSSQQGFVTFWNNLYSTLQIEVKYDEVQPKFKYWMLAWLIIVVCTVYVLRNIRLTPNSVRSSICLRQVAMALAMFVSNSGLVWNLQNEQYHFLPLFSTRSNANNQSLGEVLFYGIIVTFSAWLICAGLEIEKKSNQLWLPLLLLLVGTFLMVIVS